MKVISIGTDRKIFEENSAVRRRQIEYGKMFNELHIIIFTKKIMNYEPRIKLSENVFVYATNSKNKLFYVIDAFFVIKKLIGNSQNNFIISCQDPFETGIVGVLIKLFLGLPLHIQVHTDFMHKYFKQTYFLNLIRSMISELVLKYADRVRVVSERIRKSIEHFSKNIDVLPIKIDIKKESKEEIKKPFPFTLVMVCRLEKEKNIETILQAVKNLESSDIGLYIVGDGSERKHLEKIAEDLGILDRVIFAGWRNDLAPYYEMGNAFVSASLYEGYGISTVEAAYFGKVLILSDTGTAREIFRENESAFICDAKDSACFTESISKIYKSRDLAEKMGQSAKIAADKLLSSEENYLAEYAKSILETVKCFKKRNFTSRIFDFKKTIWHSFIVLRYFICGITAAAINISSLYIFTDIIGIWYLYSSIIAFFVSLVVSFLLQKFVVFRNKDVDKTSRQFSKFFVAAILGVISNTTLVYIFTDIINIWYIISQIIAGIFVMVQNFLFYKFFIFKK